MAFLVDTQELKPGLIIFRRADVKHRQSYCRIKVPKTDRYKTVSLKTGDIDAARERAFDQDADLRFRIKHEVPIFNRPFSSFSPAYAYPAGTIAIHSGVDQVATTTRRRAPQYGLISSPISRKRPHEHGKLLA